AQIVDRVPKDINAPKEQVLVVQGFIDSQNNAYLTKIVSDKRSPKNPPASSPYHLVVFGAADKKLSDTAMDVSTSFGDHGARAQFLSAQTSVSGAEKVEIQENGNAIARRVRSSNSPKVWDVDIRTEGGEEHCDHDYGTKYDEQHDCGDDREKEGTFV